MDYDGFEVDADIVRPIHPIYAYGIIVQVSCEDSNDVIAFQTSKTPDGYYKRRKTDDALKNLHALNDKLEVISDG
mgnify:CR=1 FL=1